MIYEKQVDYRLWYKVNQDKYALTNSNDNTYSFESVSDKRTITKVIQFSLVDLTGIPSAETGNTYNLGFGDYDWGTGNIDDTVRSQNGDRDEVLATVAAAALDFMDKHSDCTLFATGSTPGRTRSYQMGLNRFYEDIVAKHELYGLKNEGWEVFERNTNYLAFVMRRR